MLKFVTRAEHTRLHMKNMSDETRRKMSEVKKGHAVTDETRKKISEAQKRRWASKRVEKYTD